MKTRLFIVRHTETIGNVEKRLTGRKDYEITERGKILIQKLAKELENIKFDKIYSSTSGRAVKTIEPIARKQNINIEELPEEIKLNNVRILLAEDNMLNAEIAMTLLADANAYVELAPDGEKALSMLKRATDGYYDLIIMDIQMPHMNGYEATKNIRGLPDGRCRIPIIAMTANAFEEDRKRAIESGMNGYVTKPIKIEELISTIKKILKS